MSRAAKFVSHIENTTDMENKLWAMSLAVRAAFGGSACATTATGTGTPVPNAATTPSAQVVGLAAMLMASMQGSPVPAMGAVLIRHGQVTERAVAGLRALGGADPVQPDDVWHLGSNGKAMTATMVARLVERGASSRTRPRVDGHDGQLLGCSR